MQREEPARRSRARSKTTWRRRGRRRGATPCRRRASPSSWRAAMPAADTLSGSTIRPRGGERSRGRAHRTVARRRTRCGPAPADDRTSGGRGRCPPRQSVAAASRRRSTVPGSGGATRRRVNRATRGGGSSFQVRRLPEGGMVMQQDPPRDVQQPAALPASGGSWRGLRAPCMISARRPAGRQRVFIHLRASCGTCRSADPDGPGGG